MGGQNFTRETGGGGNYLMGVDERRVGPTEVRGETKKKKEKCQSLLAQVKAEQENMIHKGNS